MKIGVKQTMSNNKDTTDLFIIFGMIFAIHILFQLRSTTIECNNRISDISNV